MPSGLRRYHHSGQSHFITFTCYHRYRYFATPDACGLFPLCLETMRRRFRMLIYGYVVMPEHVHLVVSEPETQTVADAMHFLKLSFAKRLRARRHSVDGGPFWQKRYYDRNVRDAQEFAEKLDYVHNHPVKRGLVKQAGDWPWSSFRHYAYRELGVVEIESEWTVRDRETLRAGGPPRVFLSPG